MLRTFFPSAPTGLDAQRVSLTLRNPADYMGRPGYREDFISGLPLVPMPKIPNGWLADRAPVTNPDLAVGAKSFVLKYQHFSTVQRMSRRMPFFSCVNIDGTKVKKVDRSDVWRYDPRIDKKHQLITDGIYGNAGDGLFSRGHMTRREDPNWGTKAAAQTADEDTFHVANACPQFQSFNSPVWLGLEDYILQNSKDDKMEVSVFTGPVFDDDNDPVYAPRGMPPIQVPVTFWKVAIFRHDDTDKLACAAYVASQATMLPRKNLKPAFVFGEYDEFQLSVAEVEEMTGLDLGILKQADVLGAAGSGIRMRVAGLDELVLR